METMLYNCFIIVLYYYRGRQYTSKDYAEYKMTLNIIGGCIK